MNNLMIFEGNEVEIFDYNGVVLFNPYHVAQCLDIKDVNSSIRNFNEKQAVKLTNSNMHDMHFRKLHNTGEKFLTESGVYKLIFKSHKEEAERFQDWVTDEVLPDIRKHGTYMTDDILKQVLNNPDFGIKLLTTLKQEREEKKLLQQQIEENKPKIIFAEALEVAKNSILIGQLAKILRQNGIDIGQNRLFEKLRYEGYLGKKGEYYNLPTQRSMDLELFEITTRTITNADGSIRITKTTKVTGKGQIYFINKFKNKQIA